MTTTLDITVPRDVRMRGLSALLVRVGRALVAWGRRVDRPLDRDELAQHIAIQREARQAIEARGDAHHGLHQLLR
jgi:hypothetical protein